MYEVYQHKKSRSHMFNCCSIFNLLKLFVLYVPRNFRKNVGILQHAVKLHRQLKHNTGLKKKVLDNLTGARDWKSNQLTSVLMDAMCDYSSIPFSNIK